MRTILFDVSCSCFVRVNISFLSIWLTVFVGVAWTGPVPGGIDLIIAVLAA